MKYICLSDSRSEQDCLCIHSYRGNEVRLAIVVGTPLTTEWIWERNQAAKDKRGLDELPYDETDDSYTVIDGPGYEYHDHVSSLYVFALRIPDLG